jgi:serine/threonine protein kinase
MNKHPYFDLLLLDESELVHHFKQNIFARKTVQEWPLSAVEEITLNDGTVWMLKSVREPLTIEGKFYQQVNRTFLPATVILYDDLSYQSFLYPRITGNHPSKEHLCTEEILVMMDRLIQMIRSLPQTNLPHRLDVSTPQAFHRQFYHLIEKLHTLIQQCPDGHLNSQDCATLLPIINDQHLIHTLTADSTYVHGDLSADNILITPDDTLHIIDWQRMIYGSPLLDRYTFLSSIGIDPDDHLPPEAGIIACLERIDWFTDTALYWFPAFQEGYTASIAELIQNLPPIYQKFCSEE